MNKTLYILCAGASLFSASTAWAQAVSQPNGQAAADAESSGQVTDIVVTAQRREERLSTVPVSVTAFGGAELKQLQISNVNDLTNNAPAITNTGTPYSRNDLLLAIRGVAPGGVLANVDPAAGIYINGVYYARSQGANFALFDIASAEVLRGPQGTLFGRNTIAGALNVTTKAPTDDFEASFGLGMGNHDQFTANGFVSGPLAGDSVKGRLAFSHANNSGFGHATNLGTPLSDDDSSYVRGTIELNPSDNVKAVIVGDYFTGNAHGELWTLNYLDPVLASATTKSQLGPYFTGGQPRSVAVDFNPEHRSRIYDLSATLTADFGAVTLKSITAYRNVDFNAATDSDGSPVQLLDYDISLKGSQFTQEVQLSGEALDDRLTWLMGAYYFTETNTNHITVLQPTTLIHNDFEPDSKSASVFAQASYEFVPGVRFTAGLRYVRDSRDVSYPAYLVSLTSTPLAAGVSCGLIPLGLNQDPNGCNYSPPTLKFHYVPWTAGLDYRPNENSLVYAKISKGFRSGGFQQPLRPNAASYAPFQPENVLSEEIGTKLTLLDRHLFIDLSAYHTTYNDIQQNVVLSSTPPVIGVFNAGRAIIKGGELAVNTVLGDLRLGGSLGIIDPKFTKGPYVGTPLPTVAKTTWALRADYPIETGSGTLDLHADYNYRSKQYFANTRNPANGLSYTAAQIASFTQRAYGLLNAKITYTLKNPDLAFSIWGKNLTDKYYARRAGNTFAAGWNTIAVGEPLTFGASIEYKFGR